LNQISEEKAENSLSSDLKILDEISRDQNSLSYWNEDEGDDDEEEEEEEYEY
jgi:hypothetical protein